MRAISSFSLEAGISTFWCRALIALRIRVSISATGSVNLMRSFSSIARMLRPFLLCAEEPATTSVTLLPAARVKPRPSQLPGRLRNPGNLATQRQTAETQTAQAELAQKRARTPADLAAVVSSRGKFRLRRLAVARLAKHLLYLFVLNSFCSSHETFLIRMNQSINDSISQFLRPERHAERTQQSSRLVVAAGCGHNGDVHALLLVHLGVINFRKNQLVVQAERVIPAAIERLRGNSLKVTHTRQYDVDQPVEKFIHAIAAQSNHRADCLAFAHLEGRDGFLGPRHHRLLAGNLAQFIHRRIENLRVLRGFAHTHVDHNLVQMRHCHGILQIEFLHQSGSNFLLEARLQPRRLFGAMTRDCGSFLLFLLSALFFFLILCHCLCLYLSSVVPHFLHTRTFRSPRTS